MGFALLLCCCCCAGAAAVRPAAASPFRPAAAAATNPPVAGEDALWALDRYFSCSVDVPGVAGSQLMHVFCTFDLAHTF